MNNVNIKEDLACIKNNKAKKSKTTLVKDKKDLVKFVDLTRDMFTKETNDVLKDFRNKTILRKYFKNELNQDCYYANLLAFDKDTSLYQIKKALYLDFGKEISLEGYKYNPAHYKYDDYYLQEEYEEELFRFEKEEIDNNPFIEKLDLEAYNSLYNTLIKAIRERYIMLFNLESVPSILHDAMDCYCLGVSCRTNNLIMNNKIEEFRKLMTNEEVKEWLKTGVNDIMFDDYVETYQKLLRQLTGIRNTAIDMFNKYNETKSKAFEAMKEHNLDECIKYFQELDIIKCDNPMYYWHELLHNPFKFINDPYENDILNNECLEFDNYYDNVDDDNEYLENNEIFD